MLKSRGLFYILNKLRYYSHSEYLEQNFMESKLFSFIEPFMDHAKDQPWFASFMVSVIAIIIVMLLLAFVGKMGLKIIDDVKKILGLIEKMRPVKKTFRDLAAAEDEANAELTKLAKDYGADRAAIMLFHNGKTSLGNIHMLSTSVKSEGGSGNYPKIAKAMEGIPTLMYGKLITNITTKNTVEVYDCSLRLPQIVPEISMMLEQYSVKSFYMYPAVTPDGDVDGCIFLQYCKDKRELTKMENDEIKSRGQAIYTKLHGANNV